MLRCINDKFISVNHAENAVIIVNKLPVYATVIMVILALIIILCGAAGVVYYIRIKNGKHSDPNTTVEMDKPVAPQQPVTETNGRSSAVYEDIEAPGNYQGLYIEVDQPITEIENNNDTKQHENIPNAIQKTEGPHYVNTNLGTTSI